MKISKALTWNELANEYDRCVGGRKARTLPLDVVADWAEKQTDKFFIDPKEYTIHKIIEERKSYERDCTRS